MAATYGYELLEVFRISSTILIHEERLTIEYLQIELHNNVQKVSKLKLECC